jgi:hypothetical protein
MGSGKSIMEVVRADSKLRSPEAELDESSHANVVFRMTGVSSSFRVSGVEIRCPALIRANPLDGISSPGRKQRKTPGQTPALSTSNLSF